MKIAFTGGSGFIASHFKSKHKDYDFVDLKRDKPVDDWIEKLSTSDVVINLAGAPIFQKWNAENRSIIEQSRVQTTRKLVTCLNEMGKDVPQLLISGSAIGIYSNEGNRLITEDKPIYGTNFLSEVVKKWEAETNHLNNSLVRLVIPRIGIVLGNKGGIIKQMKPFFKLGLGGELASGKQKMAFIHIDDLVNAFRFFIEKQNTSGIYNMVSPTIVSNKEFTSQFAHALHRWVFLPIPSFVLKILFGESAEIMLKGEWVEPKRLLETNFEYQYPKLEEALKDLVSK